MAGAAGVAERHERVSPQVPRSRFPARTDGRSAHATPRRRPRASRPATRPALRAVGSRLVRPPFLDAAVPRADVLADVAAVDRRAEVLAVLLGNRAGPLRRPGEAPVRVEHAGVVERPGRAGLDAERAGAAVSDERRRRLELDVGDERPEHDPRAVAARDQHRVLPVEAEAGAGGCLPVDVLVRVHEHEPRPPSRGRARRAARGALRTVPPRVPRQPALPSPRSGAGA